MADLTIKSDELDALVQRVVLDSLSDEAKHDIIAQAVAHLNKPEVNPTGFGRKQGTPLQHALDTAVRSVAHEVAREVVAEHPEIKNRLRGLMGEALVGLMAEEYPSGVGLEMAEVLTTAIRERLREMGTG